jgi:drug/metabolite transporter (DMT)-like permease
MTRMKLVGTLIAYGGVVALFWKSVGGGTGTLLGDGLTLISAILLAERQVYISKSSHRLSVPKMLLAQGVIGIAAFLAFSFIIERDPWAWNGEFALAMLYTGVVIAGFGFIGNTWLLTRYLPSGVTVVSLSQPVVGVVLSWWLLDEAVGPELYVGAALVVAGSFIAQRPARPSRAAGPLGAAPRAPDTPQPGATR